MKPKNRNVCLESYPSKICLIWSKITKPKKYFKKLKILLKKENNKYYMQDINNKKLRYSF